MSLVAHRNTDPSKPFVSVETIVREHWAKFGRNYFSRYDYEEVDSKQGDAVINHIAQQIADGSLIGKTLSGGEGSEKRDYVVSLTDNFSYTDPIDKSVSTNQVYDVLCHQNLFMPTLFTFRVCE